ncbi:BTAD domain-containing putative transcriptional regulator [Qaidamihabitans albus]|uniref:BTAD domain-containing putative transcriptional regulator n=1 Tax=Qaidamihabitans albus TaxID=2795733 RepID=UPI0018F1788F|nr:BTAD domain-containing putative transcriptional regulator [Qaidamihabitans albus]
MRFEILGGLAVRDGDTSVPVPGAKQRALLGFLLVHRNRPIAAERIIDELWGANPPAKALNALQAKVSSLRSALAPGDPDRGRAILAARDGAYQLNVPVDMLDAARFAHLVGDGRRALDAGHTARAYALLEDALALWRGPPLPEYQDYPYAVAAAEALTAQWLGAVELHATAWLVTGGRPGVPDELALLLAEHPLRESLRALLMRTLARQGRQSEALTVFQEGRRLLRDELGIDPGPDLRAAQAEVLAQPESAGAATAVPSRLPAESTTFVGRVRQRQRLRDLLARERLVTVTGPGGIGKTRLVVHTLHTITQPADGVWFTDLRAIGDGTDRLTAVAEATLRVLRDRTGADLGVDETVRADPGRDALTRLCDRIGTSDLVLVLDNGEHVSAELAAFAHRLLADCPGARVVTTTRVVLGLPEESVLRLEPLPAPEPAASREARLASEAVALFCARARLDGETLSEDDLGHVAGIVRRADGVPLAIEVAAGLLRGLTLADLDAHLHAEQRLTLTDTIDRSWQLLTDEEIDLLSRVAVIEGPWCLDAAHALAAPQATHGEVVSVVARLVDRSLISHQPENTDLPYRLLDSIRAYALRRLRESPHLREVELAHATYFQVLAERTDRLLRGAEQPTAFRRLTAVHADLVTAIGTFGRHGRAADALRLASSLGWYWWLSGRRQDGRVVLEQAIAAVDEQTPDRAAAQAWAAALAFSDSDSALRTAAAVLDATSSDHWDAGLRMVAILTTDRLFQRGDPVQARALLDEISKIAERFDDEWLTAAARLMAGIGASLYGTPGQGRHCAEAALAGFTAAGDLWGQAQSLDLLAGIDEMIGDYDAARRARERVIELADHLGLADVRAYQLVRIGNLCGLAGELDAAEAHLLRARDLSRELGLASTTAYAVNGLGLILRRAGRPHEAKVHHEAALRHYRRVGSPSGVAFTCAAAGLAAAATGDLADARTWQRTALAAALRTGDQRAVALALEGLAVACPQLPSAAVLLGAAAALRDAAGAPRPAGEIPEADQAAAAVREELPAAAARAAAATGAEWADNLPALTERVGQLALD